MSERPGNTVICKLCGRIDADNSEAVKQELMSELEGKSSCAVVLDADQLSYISSAGIRVLLQLIKTCPKLSMINVHPDVYEILETTGFTEMITVEKALRTISVEGCDVIGSRRVRKTDLHLHTTISDGTDTPEELLAHPSLGSGDQMIIGEALERRIRTLLSYGLQGVEAFYPRFTEKQTGELLALAEKYGLYVTAGSDYHGTNKSAVPGMTGMDRAEELPDGFRRFLKDVTYIH